MTATRLVPLADLIGRGPEDREAAPGFVADLHGENVEVTAVLQRTAVIAPLRDRWADKQVVAHGDLVVDPAVIRWRPKEVLAWRGPRNTVGQGEAQRAAIDHRARADQARQAGAEAEAAARETAAGQRQVPTRRQGAGATTTRPAATTVSARCIAVSKVSNSAPDVLRPEPTLAAELRRARERVAELEAELERHRAVERELLERVELVVGRRAA